MKGPQFGPLHELFDKVAEELDGFADEVAERAVQLGGVARGTVQSLATETRLAAYRARSTSSSGRSSRTSRWSPTGLRWRSARRAAGKA